LSLNHSTTFLVTLELGRYSTCFAQNWNEVMRQKCWPKN